MTGKSEIKSLSNLTCKNKETYPYLLELEVPEENNSMYQAGRFGRAQTALSALIEVKVGLGNF